MSFVLTSEQIRAIHREYQSGRPIADFANLHGVTVASIYIRFKKLGLPVNKIGFNQVGTGTLYDPFEEGPKTIKQLCKDARVLVSEPCIRERLRDSRISLIDAFTKPRSFKNLLGRQWSKNVLLYNAFGLRAPSSVLHAHFGSPINLGGFKKRLKKLGDNPAAHLVEEALTCPTSKLLKRPRNRHGMMVHVFERKCLVCNRQLDFEKNKSMRGMCNTCYVRVTRNHQARRIPESGFPSVYRCVGGWKSSIMIYGKRHNLGVFLTPEQASAAYQGAVKQREELYFANGPRRK